MVPDSKHCWNLDPNQALEPRRPKLLISAKKGPGKVPYAIRLALQAGLPAVGRDCAIKIRHKSAFEQGRNPDAQGQGGIVLEAARTGRGGGVEGERDLPLKLKE